VCLVRDPKATDLPFPAEIHAWSDGAALRDIDAVIHLAGESIGARRWTKAQKAKIVESRVGTTEKLLAKLKAANGRRPRVFLSASGAGYYGDRGDEILNEESAPGAGFLTETCLAWEGTAKKAASFIPRLAILRTGIVLGRGGGALAAMLPLFKTGLGGKLGSGRQWMSWIHLDDLVQLYCFALENEKVAGPLNGTAPHPVTNAEFTKTLGEQLKKPTVLPAPAIALKLALGEMSALLLEGQRLSSKAEALGFTFRYPYLKDALGAVFKRVERARGAFFHEHTARTYLPAPPERVFQYLTMPKHFAALTPPSLEFKLEGQCSVRLRENSVVDYSFRAGPWRPRVRSVVLNFVENHRFATTHQRGPFTFWHHGRSFERLGGGTLLTEKIIYRCRGGLPGHLLGARWVERRLGEAFRYRKRELSRAIEAEDESPQLAVV